jgi:hypothetical protein
MVTGGDLHQVQLRARRPIWVDGGGLDGLPYALESGPLLDRLLRDVYGVDLFHPPAEARGGGRVPAEANRAHWEQYSLGRWRQISQDYDVTQVLTPAGWTLDLPVVAASESFRLYGIPRAEDRGVPRP